MSNSMIILNLKKIFPLVSLLMILPTSKELNFRDVCLSFEEGDFGCAEIPCDGVCAW